ncbi:fructosamine kinase family protein [Vibrio sp. TH_r3]|uniref:fructosamine kinase family protein n=1 Tax=Vibrio sp. TH_r3 TaxID=3082084 RepID=UPI002952C990|nr:fructosamine kinase family protein [Vibrio sp. TH_r3]MDV7104403.1 fructosamine kinase family protein [Vibrio sp. TH_r3]
MWQAIAKQLSDTLLFDFKIIEKEKVNGGDINDCYMISDGDQRYFIKCNSRDFLTIYESEQDNLCALRATNTIYIPELVHVGHSKNKAFIILNYLPTKPLTDEKSSYQLGVQLAKLHQWGEQKEYGFDDDNYIGAIVQPNAWNKKWCRFFSEQRIGWQLQLLAEKGISFGDIDDIVALVNQKLSKHNPKPALLHGNLALGNVANSPFGPLCYDPACYWGDRECDLAMTELFAHFQPEFYRGYNNILPIDTDYAERKPIYNLYHVLNHCNLFGGHFLAQAEQILNSLTE